ncbi:MAG: zinc ribbon domain-containing protein [Treponema sp.]|nr:zinc ribbon domain-containing protein [Treponema sp.]
MKQKAKFFCENCGAEVPEKARVCQHCGKFFASVRCPMCGTIGSVSQFTHGCPQCGYARTGTTAPARPRRLHRPRRRTAVNDNSLPSWMYAIALAGLIAVVGTALYFLW